MGYGFDSAALHSFGLIFVVMGWLVYQLNPHLHSFLSTFKSQEPKTLQWGFPIPDISPKMQQTFNVTLFRNTQEPTRSWIPGWQLSLPELIILIAHQPPNITKDGQLFCDQILHGFLTDDLLGMMIIFYLLQEVCSLNSMQHSSKGLTCELLQHLV